MTRPRRDDDPIPADVLDMLGLQDDWPPMEVRRRIEDVHLPDPPSFRCPECGMISYHPEDVRTGYCGACHDFTGEPS